MHLDGARLAQHPHQRPLGVAAHDRVVDDDQPLAADDFLERVELEPDAQLADGLRRLDERAPDVGVLRQALPVRECRTPARSRRRRGCRIPGRRSPGRPRRASRWASLTPDVDPGLVHRPACRWCCPAGPGRRIRRRSALGFGIGEAGGAQAVGVDRDQLAGLRLARRRRPRRRRCPARRAVSLAAAQPRSSRPSTRAGGCRAGRGRRTERALVHEDQAERAAHRR